MNPELPPQSPKGLDMYFSKKVTRDFAEHEQNEKNFKVAEIVDRAIQQVLENKQPPIAAAELGGGAHPDRYHQFFQRLLQEPRGHLDWVDVSPHMLELAKEYLDTDEYREREEVIKFIQSDIIEYLRTLDDNHLDLALMKYTIDHIQNLDELFELLSEKLKEDGTLIATIGLMNPELKSFSTNARFFYNGEPIPDDETRQLKDGDQFTIKFLQVSGDPNSGFIEGAETTKYYHSPETIKELAQAYGFEIFLGDWKHFVKQEQQEGETLDQDILVLTKKEKQ